MRYWNADESNLNSLLSLQALIEERSISRAASRMLLTQSAMSRILDRLQVMFKDELLVRTSIGYEPTHRALAIYAELELLLPKLHRLYNGNEFNPAEATGLFKLAATDYGIDAILPGLIEQLEKLAPG